MPRLSPPADAESKLAILASVRFESGAALARRHLVFQSWSATL
jgi:hypothetical protein